MCSLPAMHALGSKVVGSGLRGQGRSVQVDRCLLALSFMPAYSCKEVLSSLESFFSGKHLLHVVVL